MPSVSTCRDYTELTRHTTGEHAGRFDDFKNEELIALIAMLEEYPSGMIKTPGLKYIVRRLDGTPHPTNTTAAAGRVDKCRIHRIYGVCFQRSGA